MWCMYGVVLLFAKMITNLVAHTQCLQKRNDYDMAIPDPAQRHWSNRYHKIGAADCLTRVLAYSLQT